MTSSIKITIKENKLLKESQMSEQEFSKKLGWQRFETESAGDDLEYPTEMDFIEEEPTLQYEKIQNVVLGVINRVPLRPAAGTSPGLYEEYIIDAENNLNPLVGFNRMKRHIKQGRTLNFGFIGERDGQKVNVLFISVDGDEPRMFVRYIQST